MSSALWSQSPNCEELPSRLADLKSSSTTLISIRRDAACVPVWLEGPFARNDPSSCQFLSAGGDIHTLPKSNSVRPRRDTRETTMRLLTKLAAAALTVALTTTLASAQSVVVSSKIDTEGGLLGNIISQVLQANYVPVTEMILLGATSVVRQAITAGQIDLYPEYTGNGAFFFNKADDPEWNDATKAYDAVAKLDYDANKIVWLAPAPANNTWAVALRKDVTEQNKLVTFSDFGKWVAGGGQVKLAACGAQVPVSLWLHAEAGAAGDALGWRYRRNDRGGGQSDRRRQCRDGLWQRRRHRALGAGGAAGRQGCAAGLPAGADHPRGGAEA